MKFFDIIRTANHNLFRSKVRTILTILAIFVGSFTIILNVAINSGVNGFIDDQVNTVGGEDYLVITKGDLHANAMSAMGLGSGEIKEYQESQNLDYLRTEDLEKIKKIDGIKPESVSEREFGVTVDYIRNKDSDKRFVGNIAGSMPPGNIRIPISAGEIAKSDAGEDVVTLMPGYAKVLGYANDADIIGKTIILGVRDNVVTKSYEEFPVKVVGVVAPGVVAMDAQIVSKQLVNKLESVNEKYTSTANRDILSAAQASFDLSKYSEDEIKEKIKAAGYNAITTRDMVGEIRTFFDVILVVFSIFGGIALLAAAIGVINTLYMSVEERTREIGLDKALGMSSGRVFLEFATEAILLGFWGSAFGIGVAMTLGYFANSAVHAPGAFLEAFPTFELFKFTLDGILPIMILVMIIAFIAGTLPALRAARKNPIEALRYE